MQVVRGKTAALFSAATEAGGVVAGAPEDHQKALYVYGDALGISFQIADDLLDYGGATATIGKNVGDDFRERKLTLPLIKAVAAANETELTFWKKVIEKGHQENGDLEHALELLNKHDALELARQDALTWSERAKAALDPLPDHELKTMLHDLADFVVARIS